jgi:hypothetical protein
VETDNRLCDVLKTGMEVEVDMEKDVLTELSSGRTYDLKSLGDVSCMHILLNARGFYGFCVFFVAQTTEN